MNFLTLPSDIGSAYYNRYAEASRSGPDAELVSVTFRGNADFVADLEAIAKFFGTSRTTILLDLLGTGLRVFQEQYAHRCFSEDDLASLQALIDARGQKGLTAEGIFDRIRDGQEAKQ